MIRAASALVAFAFLTAALAVILAALRIFKRPGAGAVSMAYSRAVCALLGLRVASVGAPERGHPVLVVANHASWADILAITATVPAIFVAKREVARWPLIGLVARARGTVFVDRDRRRQTSQATAEIASRLERGAVIVLFGEGTSSDGNRILPFRSSLLGAVNATLTQAGAGTVRVQPLSLAYTRVRGLPMGRRDRPLAAWYGDTDLLPHIWKFLRRGPVDVMLTWGDALTFDTHADRKALTRSLEQTVRGLTAQALRRGHSFLPREEVSSRPHGRASPGHPIFGREASGGA